MSGNPGTLVRIMRFPFVRCLVLLLALALISGNVHARPHAMPAEHTTAPEHDHHAGTSSNPDNPRDDKGLRYCCDWLGCATAYTVTPDLRNMVPAIFGTPVRYAQNAVFLRGRALLPEPEPPRTGALI